MDVINKQTYKQTPENVSALAKSDISCICMVIEQR